MARPPKRGLDYFPVDVDIFQDPKVMDLIAKYSTDGFTIYMAILGIVYRCGYYFEAESEDAIIRAIVKEIYDDRLSRQRVREVLHFCGVIRLLDSRLLCANVVTSPAIQERYMRVTVRNKVDKSKYWLLSENENEDRALESAPENEVSATETPISATEIQVSATETQTNKSKVNKTKETTTTTYTPPSFHEVFHFLKHESLLDISHDAVAEATKFIAYNANRGWDCLPNWKEAADLWVARTDEHR